MDFGNVSRDSDTFNHGIAECRRTDFFNASYNAGFSTSGNNLVGCSFHNSVTSVTGVIRFVPAVHSYTVKQETSMELVAFFNERDILGDMDAT